MRAIQIVRISAVVEKVDATGGYKTQGASATAVALYHSMLCIVIQHFLLSTQAAPLVILSWYST